jgi:hypothetical protein
MDLDGAKGLAMEWIAKGVTLLTWETLSSISGTTPIELSLCHSMVDLLKVVEMDEWYGIWQGGRDVKL